LAGYLLLIMAIGIWVASRRSAQTGTRFAFNAAFAALCVQVVIGVVTVLYAAPLSIAIVHQAVAVLVWVLILRARFLAAYPVQQSIRR
jgi:cytochrome c oxidase assembly protein subunit 15